MDTKEQVRSALKDLVKEGFALSKMLTTDDEPGFIVNYQLWYTKAIKLIRVLAADRYQEFCGYYEPDPRRKGITIESYRIQDFFRGMRPAPHPHYW